MDKKQTTEIIKRLELGEPLTRICKDKHLPEISTVYKKIRESESLQKRVRAARETGVFTLIDKLTEELDKPVDNQQMMWKREVFSYLKWLASKLGSSTFGDKQKQEIKQNSTLTISWGRPEHDKQNSIEDKKVDKQIQNEVIGSLPRTS
tara:strand:+ start:2680 stop:3126 length:447 start_codon:yes stop_codon:yes gene_type:complete